MLREGKQAVVDQPRGRHVVRHAWLRASICVHTRPRDVMGLSSQTCIHIKAVL